VSQQYSVSLPSRSLSVLARAALISALAVGVSACSSSSSDDSASASSSISSTATAPSTTSADSSADPGETSAADPSGTANAAPPTGSDKKAVCARVVKVIQDSSRSAIAALTPALETGDQAKVAQAQTKAQTYYREAAVNLRKEAGTAADASLQKQIRAAAAYFDKAAKSTAAQGADNSLARLSETCS
jgi:hypothetical protein